jgi:hypothetical protein
MSAKDTQVGGDHYKIPIQPVEYILANDIGFCEGNIIKYVTRWQTKGGAPNVEDLRKAKHYIELLIESQVIGGKKIEIRDHDW